MAYENLYDSLSYNISNDDLTIDEKKFLTAQLPELDTEKKELIYTLILHDYSKANPNTKVVYPYKTKQLSNDKIELKLDAWPNKLKRIIYKFVKLAQESANEQAEKMVI